MAKLEELIKQIPDVKLRAEVASEVAALKANKKFGLVFEEHIPEQVQLPNLPVRTGSRVAKRGDGKRVFQVIEVKDKTARLTSEPEGKEETAKLEELVIVKRFGEPIYPTLTPRERIERASDKPWHTIINADNFHALQLLLYCYEGMVDVIYIDPPYNTGARDWKYNNDFVDSNDQWRHSKWLAMMKRRLALAKKLLKPDTGVLIVTIDEKEVHNLGLLLDEVFSEAKIQMVSTMINPANVARVGAFGRSDEYIFFVMIGNAAPQRLRLGREWVSDKGRTHTGNVRWDLLRRSGTNAARSHSPGCFYPIYVNPENLQIESVGSPIPKEQSIPPTHKGTIPVLPIRRDGSEGNWQWAPDTFKERMTEGRVRVGGSPKRGFVIYILKDGEYAKIQRGEFNVIGHGINGTIEVEQNDASFVMAVPGSQWRIASHDATQYGSRLLGGILPDKRFPFPKSVYAIRDAIRFFVEDKPNAVIIDFFAGSGTTLNAVNLLNATDGGKRRCILVTNNEVSDDEAKALAAQGYKPGDEEWEQHGICQSVTWPRTKFVINGKRDDDTELTGKYLNGRELKEGFEENIEYFRLDFADPTEVAIGEKFEAILPILWLMAGAQGKRENDKGEKDWFIPKDSPFAVLIDEHAFNPFKKAIAKRADLTHIFLVTDSIEAYRSMIAQLPEGIKTKMLYKSYLDNFKINIEGSV